jgi:uncharacterized repeat protein (TIGR03803 family)
MKFALNIRSNFVFAGIGSLAIATLAPLPMLAAPGITLQGSFAADGSNGANPYAALIAAGSGRYFGSTLSGGANGNGVIFAFDSSNGSITPQASFNGSNGLGPYAALNPAGNGLYYGTTPDGGASGAGVIFAFDSSNGSITPQASFNGSNGANPFSALTAAGNGLFYGIAKRGGADDRGAVFAFDSSNGSIILQASFNGDGSNGAAYYPQAALTAAGNGLYYGTTVLGGANDKGTVFAFDSSNGSITLKSSFDGSNGFAPFSALTAAGNGLYYGTTLAGGANNQGAIFEFDSSTGSITLLASFDGSNGANPFADLIAAGNGLYYGTATIGGANNRGAIFAFDSSTGSITLLASFDGSNGAEPYATLTAAGNGVYYGSTSKGGANDTGAIFEFDPNASSSVPGPLPLMGAGAAYGWSRRLRRRIQAVRPVFPIGR